MILRSYCTAVLTRSANVTYISRGPEGVSFTDPATIAPFSVVTGSVLFRFARSGGVAPCGCGAAQVMLRMKKPGTHMQSVEDVLPVDELKDASELMFARHRVHARGPLTALNVPVGHAVHGSFECPGSQRQAAAVVLPDGEFELAAHGCATAACSTPPGGVPRQKEPGGQSVHALLFHR